MISKKAFDKLPQYKKEFYNTIKEFGLEALPAFLSNGDWDDESWHNNEMPSWWNEKLGLVLWVNFKDKVDGYNYKYSLDVESRKDREWIKNLGEFNTMEELVDFVEKYKGEA